MGDKRAEAKRYMTHYFRKMAEASGMHWDSDNETEIENLVDLMVDAAKEEMTDTDCYIEHVESVVINNSDIKYQIERADSVVVNNN